MAQWSKEILANNLRMYMERAGKTQKDMADIIGVSAPTFSDWINAKKYPRIDKIEIMADYFGILKSDLIEDKTEEQRQMQKKNDALTNIVLEMESNPDFFSIVKEIYDMEPEKRSGLLAFLK